MALDAQAQGLGALQQQEGVERRNGGTGITQQDRTDVGDKSCGACCIGKGNAVVAGVGVSNIAELARKIPLYEYGNDFNARGSDNSIRFKCIFTEVYE